MKKTMLHDDGVQIHKILVARRGKKVIIKTENISVARSMKHKFMDALRGNSTPEQSSVNAIGFEVNE